MRVIFAITLLLRVTYAVDVSCLTIAWWSPIGGLICALAPPSTTNAVAGAFDAATTKVIDEAKTIISQAENAIDYSINYNPITLTYNFVDTASREGIAAANVQLRQEAQNISQVTIGFAKETASQGLTIVQLAKWPQLVGCVVQRGAAAGISGAYDALTHDSTGGIQQTATNQPISNQNVPTSQAGSASSAMTSRKRAVQDVQDQAISIGRKCISDQFAKPLVLNATNSLQRQGADISDVAALLIPVVGEEAAAADAATEAVDLSLPGLEDTTRILKLEEGASEGVHFASVEEAEGVSKNLADGGWKGANCQVCTAPSLSRRLSTRRFARGTLQPRGAAFSMCCPIGGKSKVIDVAGGANDLKAAGDGAIVQDAEGAGPNGGPVKPAPATSGSGTLPQGVTTEPAGTNSFFPNLQVISSLPVRTLENDIPAVFTDLSAQNSAALAYSDAAKAIADSESILTEITNIVNSEDSSLRDILQFKESKIDNRWAAESGNNWLSSTDPRLSKLQRWCTQVQQDLRSAGDKILAVDKDNARLMNGYQWQPNFNLYYTKAGTKISAATDGGILGFHTDRPYLSYSTSNVAGLTIDAGAVGAPKTPVLTPVMDNTFYILKGTEGGGENIFATRHAVGAGEALVKGRAAIVVEMARKPI